MECCLMKNIKWIASTGLVLGLLVGCQSKPTVEQVGQDFNSLTEEQQAQVIEDYISPVIEKYFEEAFEEMFGVQEQTSASTDVLNELVSKVTWFHSTDEWGDTRTVGVLENTTDQTIDYIEIEYKYKKDGVTVDSSWTNVVNIAPGEKVQIEIYTFEDFDTFEVIGSSGL